jgi:hypothetical protein
MAVEKSRRAGKGRADATPADNEDRDGAPGNFRFNIAQIYGLHFDCPHAACKRHRICSRPATVPCYGRHLRDLRRYVFPQMRRDLEQMQRERERRSGPDGTSYAASAAQAPAPLAQEPASLAHPPASPAHPPASAGEAEDGRRAGESESAGLRGSSYSASPHHPPASPAEAGAQVWGKGRARFMWGE